MVANSFEDSWLISPTIKRLTTYKFKLNLFYNNHEKTL